MRLYFFHFYPNKILMRVICTKKLFVLVAVFFAFLAAGCAHNVNRPLPLGQQEVASPSQSVLPSSGEEQPLQEEEPVTIADPLEPFNRAMYLFNDKFYFWLLKPVAQGYSTVVPEGARISVENFFFNVEFPIRFVNYLLQADLRDAATELGRFGVNTTIGIAGFFDPASSKVFDLPKQDTDMGLTLASYGIGHGFYIDWPVLGPSSPRDTIGKAGDYFLYLDSYISPWYVSLGIRGYEEVNATSLAIGDYESLKEAALDPYVALRDAYVQHRQKGIRGRKSEPEPVNPQTE